MQPEHPRRPPAARRPFRLLAVGALIATALCPAPAPAIGGAEPAASDSLLKLVPADAGLIFTVDRLREQSQAILRTLLAQNVQRLPAFKAWLDTDKVRDFLRSREQIEVFFRATLGEVRDEIFGDAVVLALRLPTGKPTDPAEARGVLVLKARDPELLRHVVDLVNSTQNQSGEIAELSEHRRGETVYHTREFHPGDARLAESFVIFPDGTFAFSNAESLIHEVIDRKTAKSAPGASGSVADLASFRAMSARLPSRAVARLFVEPRLARRLLGNLPAPASADDRTLTATAERYVGGLDYFGAALSVGDDEIKLQAVQAFLPDKFRDLAGSWISEPTAGKPGSRLLTVPTSTAALVSLNVDFPSLYRLLIGFVPAADQPKIAKLEALADGLLLGLDVRRRVLPALGPRIIAYLEPPDSSAPKADASPRGFPFPLIVAAEIDEEAARDASPGDAPTVASALDNALKTMLAAISLDEKRVPSSAHIEIRDVDGAAVKCLSTPYPFAYAVDRPGRRVVLGTSPEAVARYLEAGADPNAGARIRAIQAVAFPGCESYACLDLAAIHDLAVKHRDRLIDAASRKQERPAADVGRDLDQVLGLVQLFDAAFLSARVDLKNATLEHTVGLLPRPAAANR